MFWISVVECLMLLGLFYWLPVMRSAESFFAVRVSREFYTGEGQTFLRQYRQALLMAFALIMALSVLLRGVHSLWIWIVPMVLMIAAGVLSHQHFRQLVKPHRVVPEKTKTVASLQLRRLSEYTNVTLEIVLIFLLVLPILLLVYFYPLLPEKIPVHWNFAMQPDRWLTRSVKVVALLPVATFWLQGLLLMVKASFLKTKMPLPVRNTARYLELKEQGLKSTMRLLDGMRLLLALVLGVVTLSTIISSLPQFKPLEPVAAVFLWTSIPVVIGGLIYFVARSLSLNNQLSELAGDSIPSAAGSDEGWYGGGAFYYNPNDPALFVEKQLGIGNTLNFAHKQALYFMAYILFGATLILVWVWAAM